jgi:hypothetical protein
LTVGTSRPPYAGRSRRSCERGNGAEANVEAVVTDETDGPLDRNPIVWRLIESSKGSIGESEFLGLRKSNIGCCFFWDRFLGREKFSTVKSMPGAKGCIDLVGDCGVCGSWRDSDSDDGILTLDGVADRE